jgi:2-keto-4-pentenoate hydratase/2-oxohepta-3-ene-1,7-dioic acid hydratase in catechol pathway
MTIFCIGRNYSDHAKELNNPVPLEPVVFLKPTTALLQDNKPFYYPNFTNDLHHELELVFKVGKKGKSIQQSNALNFISHVSVGIDFTARDIQQKCKDKGLPWEISKAFDHSAVIGEWIPVDELNLSDLSFSLLKNNTQVQQGNSNQMLFSIQKIIEYITVYFKINKGDLIYTGTPSGVSAVKIGDKLEGFIQERRLFSCEIK